MNKIKWFSVALVLVLLPLVASCKPLQFPTTGVPESPSSAKFIVMQWSEGNRILVATTNTLPEEASNSIRITNYWIIRATETDENEWVRREEDYYYLLLPIADGVITVREIKGEQLEEFIYIYEGD